MGWFKSLFRGHLAEAVRETIVAVAVDSFKKGGEVAVKEAVKKITDHHRAELLAYLMGISDEKAREAFIRRHKKAISGKSGEENRFVDLLTRLWLVIKDDPKKQWVFTALGHLTDKEFNQALYFLENDVIPQWYKKAKAIIVEAANDIFKGAVNGVKSADGKLKPLADNLRSFKERLQQKEGFR